MTGENLDRVDRILLAYGRLSPKDKEFAMAFLNRLVEIDRYCAALEVALDGPELWAKPEGARGIPDVENGVQA